MEKIDFTIDSQDKSNLSNLTRLFHYAFGSFLMVVSLIGFNKLIKAETMNYTVYSNALLLLIGMLWIIRGLIGRDFMAIRKYISLTDDALILKKPLQKEMQLSKDSIEWISIKPSSINFKTRDAAIDFDLRWLSYIELQQLRAQFSEFCNVNKIEQK